MTALPIPVSSRPIIYPDSDGKPMAENSLQYDWIVKIKGGLAYLFLEDRNIFMAGDMFWYPVEGHPEICTAPDVMVAFGRPAGDRGSYRQWEEDNIPPQVVFEIVSPSNSFGEMSLKYEFYRRYGVEEYYLYDPDPSYLELSGFLRRGGDLVKIPVMHGHVSPRLKVKFEMHVDGLRLIRPDGEPFDTFEEVMRARDQARREAQLQQRRADEEQRRADEERRQAQEQRRRAEESETLNAQLKAELNRLRGSPSGSGG